MDPMMMAIIAVVVLVLIAGAVFFIKSRAGNTNDTTSTPRPSANRPKTLGEQQRELEQQRAENPAIPAVATQPVVDPLNTAQQLIQRQDFAQATAVLKDAIHKDSRRSALYLPLLNIFAQQKNLAEFNQYLTPLLALNDPTASSQAMSLKKLLDDEMAFTAQSMPAVQTTPVQAQPVPMATQPESLDFDDFDFNQTSTPIGSAQPVMATPTAQVAVSQVEDTLSFDDIEFPSISSPTTHATPSPTPTSTLVEDLDFNFDDADMGIVNTDSKATNNSPIPPSATPTTATSSSDLDDFSFDFDETVAPVATNSPTTPDPMVANTPVSQPLTDELSFDEDFSFDEPAITAVPATTPAPLSPPTPAVVEADDFDFGIDDFEVAQPTPQAVVSPAAPAVQAPEVVEDFDFNFEETPMSSPIASATMNEASNQPVVATGVDDFGIDEFNFDLDDAKTEATVMPSTPVIPNEPIRLTDTSEDMVFGLTQESRPSTVQATPAVSAPTEVRTPVVTQTVETFEDDFDLDFDMPPTSTVADNVATPVVANPVVEKIEDTPAFELDKAPVVPPQTSSEPAVHDLGATTTLGNEYDTLNQLDQLYATDNSPVTDNTSATQPVANSPTPLDASIAPTTLAPVALDTEILSIVNGLDTNQLNLDLASQYIQLGEYDSAKRLLSEVNQPNPQQQQQFNDLLHKIG